jgi:pyridoxine 5-phosphate synthase
MTSLSVNINKVALIRNSRGKDLPNLVHFATDCEEFGADGITVHPRPDERHIRYTDVGLLKDAIRTELNVEGYPSPEFLKLMEDVRPHQCTLVPDPPGVLTSSEGWDTIHYQNMLSDIVKGLQNLGIRVSLFLDPLEKFVEAAAQTGTDRIEFYTGKYAENYAQDRGDAISPHIVCGNLANQLGLEINAGHDLNLQNLAFYAREVPRLKEVSIGHALITDALYYGIQNTVGMYKNRLR